MSMINTISRYHDVICKVLVFSSLSLLKECVYEDHECLGRCRRARSC
jgi:hypothetical protein